VSERSIDLNADLGESFGRWRLGDDDALLAVVSSANVACGFHAGDPSTMRRSCELAVRHGVRIGAQVGYRDLVGFGRREIDYEPAELADDVLYQIGALDGFARAAGDRVRYVKPHGALYNRTVRDRRQADAVTAAVAAYDRSLPLLGLPGSSLLASAAEAGLDTVGEAFADRAYTATGELTPRRVPGAVLADEDAVLAQVTRLVTEQQVIALTGELVPMRAGSLCVHGDTPGAARLAVQVRATLTAAGVRVAAFR
jgi:UPF0271 protein